MVHSSSEFKCIRTYLGTLVQVIFVQNCLSQLKPALFQFCVGMDTAGIQYILNQKTLCRFMIRKNDSMCLHSKEFALCGIRDVFDWDKNGQHKNASFQSFTPFSTTSMLLTVY